MQLTFPNSTDKRSVYSGGWSVFCHLSYCFIFACLEDHTSTRLTNHTRHRSLRERWLVWIAYDVTLPIDRSWHGIGDRKSCWVLLPRVACFRNAFRDV